MKYEHMGQALYRKHRPRTLEEVAGQEHIIKTLTQALKQQQISHAYLLTGPRGVGKTSVARILAHAINQLPYSDDSAHLDIIEIDAASNRRIDEIRELRERVYIAPTSAKYKVYIIDEVHMLTREAFNALLKTLEEPPAHVVFILATTEVQKLPDTIISRTQRYSFKPISVGDMTSHLEQMAKDEKIKISPEALKLLAEHGQGSLRDSVSLLDQASSQGNAITLETATELLGLPPAEALNELLSATIKGQGAAVIVGALNSLYDQGYQAAVISKQLGQIVRSKLINSEIDSELALDLLASLIEVPTSHNPERYLEIALLKVQPSVVTVVEPVAEVKEEKPKVAAVKAKEETVLEPEAKPKDVVPDKKDQSLPFDDKLWGSILLALKQKHNTLYGVVRMAEPKFYPDDKLDLLFAFEFHKKRLSEASNRQMLSETIKELTGKAVVIECHWDKKAEPPMANEIKADVPDNPDDISAISSIFNGAELLES